MDSVEIPKVIQCYYKGSITKSELHSRIIQAAATQPPVEVAAILDTQLLQIIRDEASSPPLSFDKSPRIINMGSWAGPHDQEAEEREQRSLWFEGIWRWHQYFTDGEVSIGIEPIRRGEE